MQKLYVTQNFLDWVKTQKPDIWSQERFDKWVEETFDILEIIE
jgi:hypothetical protein